MIIIRHHEVRDILAGREPEVVGLVERTYTLHDQGESAVPHSVFLRFPGDQRNRIIGLPAFAGGPAPAAGMKWVSSFPGNLDLGVERASAAILLNSLRTGRPEALVEGSLVSAKRTAASAALAARVLTRRQPPAGVSLVGCGVINFEVLRFLAAVLPSLTEVTLADSDPERAKAFAERCAALLPSATVTCAVDAEEAVAAQRLVSLATTATEPHLGLSSARPGAVVLHVSLRDLYPETILHSRNVVDDADHVCRERTSLDLAERLTGGRRFIDASIGQLLRGTVELEPDEEKPVVFSPFGLGVLDIALAEHVRAVAAERELGVVVDDFLAGSGTDEAHGG